MSLLSLPEILGEKKPHTHLPTFVDQKPKKYFSCDCFKNLITAFVIKTLFRMSA